MLTALICDRKDIIDYHTIFFFKILIISLILGRGGVTIDL